MSMRDQINALVSPVARQLLGGLLDELERAIVVPNHLLPANFRSDDHDTYSCIKGVEVDSDGYIVGGDRIRTKGRTVREINKLMARA